ncbi:MAG: hypothetical protein CVU81_00710 [Euryarchaeota archaeon HGW-Euryarchaeota-1]|nr:MAG: hypothetical protein CVU81_00710 [Euryarchaeota archaeon HGW-Euryarchaeota-1]
MTLSDEYKKARVLYYHNKLPIISVKHEFNVPHKFKSTIVFKKDKKEISLTSSEKVMAQEVYFLKALDSPDFKFFVVENKPKTEESKK